MSKTENIISTWAVQYRWVIIITTLLIVLSFASGMRFLTLNKDLRVFFSKDNPQLHALEALENDYTKIQNIFFVIEPLKGNIFTQENLSAIEELTKASWKIPYSSRVDSITNFQHTWADGDDLIVEDLVQGAKDFSDNEIKRIKETALAEPLLVNRLISTSGHVTGVNINIILPGKSSDEIEEVAKYSRTLVDNFQKRYRDIKLHLTGEVMLDNGFGEVSQDDMLTLVPLMFVTLIIIVGLMLRSFMGIFLTLLVIILSTLTGVGFAGWMGISLNPATTIAPTIILTLSVADSVHILAIVFQQMGLGKSKKEAIMESLRINFMPVLVTSVTTALGFLTMNFSDAPPFRDMGNIVAVGVMAAFLYSIFFLPSIMTFLPIKTRPKSLNSNKSLDNFANLVIRRNTTFFWTILILAIILSAGIFKIDLYDNWIKYFDKSYDFRRATDFLEGNLSGFDFIEYSLGSGKQGGVYDPEYLKTVEQFTDWYRQQPNVVHVSSIVDTVKKLNKNMHGDDISYYGIPNKHDLTAQYLLLYEMSLPLGLHINDIINIDKSATRFTVTIRETTTKGLIDIDRKAQQWLKENAPQSMFTTGTGLSMMYAHTTYRNMKNMLIVSFGALIMISAILIIVLRSLKLGLISLIPNIVPAIVAYGIWGAIVGQVGLGLSVIVAMTLGIVVDDSVHFMIKYLRARKEYKKSVNDAIRYAFTTVGKAMMVTTVALVAGFLVLSFSKYKVNADMGIMTALTITIACIMDFLFLPSVLLKTEKNNV